uniref:Ribosomal protein S4/S9 N-terminal domain-containing protein n=1 Tax=Ditylenchus dipsaci TaxID=166011 RepID=A0A915E9M2_9BILA
MVRKLKYHEQKLLKKVDFVNWETDNSPHENKIMRKYHIEKREHYTLYNKLSREVRDLAAKVRDLNDRNPNKAILARRLLGKLYDMGVVPTADTLERCDKVSASSFCRRRLPVVMFKMQMAPSVKKAHTKWWSKSDNVTWSRESKVRQHVSNYNNERDDFDA